MNKLLQKLRVRRLSNASLDRSVQYGTITTAIVTMLSFLFSIFWTTYGNYCQDKQWTATYEAKKAQLCEMSEQNGILQNTLEKMSSQNKILESAVT